MTLYYRQYGTSEWLEVDENYLGLNNTVVSVADGIPLSFHNESFDLTTIEFSLREQGDSETNNGNLRYKPVVVDFSKESRYSLIMEKPVAFDDERYNSEGKEDEKKIENRRNSTATTIPVSRKFGHWHHHLETYEESKAEQFELVELVVKKYNESMLVILNIDDGKKAPLMKVKVSPTFSSLSHKIRFRQVGEGNPYCTVGKESNFEARFGWRDCRPEKQKIEIQPFGFECKYIIVY